MVDKAVVKKIKRDTRIKKGHTLNPNGRPLKDRVLSDAFRRYLEEETTIILEVAGQERLITLKNKDAIAITTIHDAIFSKDAAIKNAARKHVLNYVDGLPKFEIDVDHSYNIKIEGFGGEDKTIER